VATAEQIKALIQSHIEGDEERFRALAIQLAAQAARKGQGKFAQELKRLLDQAAKIGDFPPKLSGPVPLAQPRGELAGLLSVFYPKVRLSDMVLEESVHERLRRVLVEQRQQQKLTQHGLTPRRKLLLTGPPGAGKTMSASALAGELHLPLFTIVLDGLITKYMGETAVKLRVIFDAIAKTRGVYLFDEFDAIGAKRVSSNDVGEIRRVLNSFLQFLEQDTSSSLIVAATNHVEMLDRALFRRFDDVIDYPLPTSQLAERTIRARLPMLSLADVNWPSVLDAAKGLSYADLARACENVAKEAILSSWSEPGPDSLQRALSERSREK
jgi:SpoVK/Ycf46/Vps4 family AAA+-type ATPase